MALSIGGLHAYNNVSFARSMNYAVSNQSDVSDAYMQSVEKTNGSGAFSMVDAVHPVQYPNTAVQMNTTAQVEKSQAVNRDLNTIASSFSGQITGYSADLAASNYGMIGSQLDLYA